MKRGTKLFLLAGCACVLILAGPRAVATFTVSWRGPYAEDREEPAAHARHAFKPYPVLPALLELARR